MTRRLAVLGAGPIGIEAALLGVERGYEVAVYERDAVGASLSSWGPTRFFSPFGMNVSPRVKAALGANVPDDDALLTGPEFVQRVLAPIVDGPLAGRVHEGETVVQVGRDRLLRHDKAGHPIRGDREFRILLDGPNGEHFVTADVVLDATGATVPSHLGRGGMLAAGEREVRDRLWTTLGDVHRRLPELDGQHVLIVGHGHSAANAIHAIADAGRDVRVTWATRAVNKRPCVEVANDPLPERAAITRRANDLAHRPPAWLTVERRAHVEAIRAVEHRVEVTLSGDRTGVYDAVASFVGYRPDTEMLSELPIAISPVSQGAAGIQRALANVTDCLAVPRIGADDLASGEPGFYMIGFKSYGRMTAFLLKDGLTQLEAIFADGLG
ncbi:MAG: FAD-dependent oxidoreductase [Deltaproteobacteria bacterium]